MSAEFNNPRLLNFIRFIHTIIWAFFAGCVVLIPISSYLENFFLSFMLILIVMLEVVIFIFNRWTCPLTNIAAKYTDERVDNFDIYLPLWVARYNKLLFGLLFVFGFFYTFVKWFEFSVIGT